MLRAQSLGLGMSPSLQQYVHGTPELDKSVDPVVILRGSRPKRVVLKALIMSPNPCQVLYVSYPSPSVQAAHKRSAAR